MRYVALGLLTVLNVNAHANVYQFFTGLSFANPSEMFRIKENEFIIGGTIPDVTMHFTGSSFNGNTLGYGQGAATSHTAALTPYGRIAHRFNERLVLGVDITEPYYANVNWGNNSVLRYVTTKVRLTDVDISPRASWQVNKRFYIGGGLNFNSMSNTQLNFAVPVSATQYSTLTNKLAAFNTGYDLGAYFIINKSNFVGMSYFSSIQMNLSGTSQLGARSNPNLSSPLKIPATTSLSYTHLFSPTWLTNLQFFYTQWGVFQNIYLTNTALGRNLVIPSRYYSSYAVVGAVRNQFSEKLGLTLIGVADKNPVPERFRSPGLPADNKYFIGLSGDYKLNKITTVQLIYGHGFSNSIINTSRTLPNGQKASLTHGNISVNADAVDLRVKVAY